MFFNPHIFELWVETGAPGRNSCRHKKHMQTPHRPRSTSTFKPRTCLLPKFFPNYQTTSDYNLHAKVECNLNFYMEIAIVLAS